MLLLSVVITPVLEYFDRWDLPGLSSDTEFAIFALVLIVCLLLAVCKLLADHAHRANNDVVELSYIEPPPEPRVFARLMVAEVIPSISPPLRI